MTADDIKWICKGGGYLWVKNGVPESGRFNGGQKIFYFIMVATCILMSITGYIMIYPFDFAKDTVVMCLSSAYHRGYDFWRHLDHPCVSGYLCKSGYH